MKIIKNLEKLLFSSTLLLIPTQLALHFWPNSALVFGIRIDYLAPTVYLTDVFLLALFITWSVLDLNFIKRFVMGHTKQLLIVLAFALVNSFVSHNLFITLVKWVSVLKLSVFALYLSRRVDIFGKDRSAKFILTSLVVVSSIGIAQFVLGHTIGGFFYFLGERSFSLSTPGIALVQLFGIDQLRVYSIFPHPNALAGYLVGGILLLSGLSMKRTRSYWVLITVVSVCFLMTFSLSSVIGLLTVLTIVSLVEKGLLSSRAVQFVLLITIVLSLIAPLVSKFLIENKFTFPTNVSERLSLSVSAGEMMSKSFLFGVGLNQFIPSLVLTSHGAGFPLLLQPVHNIFLLVASELGIIGLILLSSLLNKLLKVSIKNNNVYFITIFVFILVTGFFDHYWFTINQNLLLIAFSVGVSMSKK